MKRIYVIYNKRTCVTGRALFEKLSEKAKDFIVRRCNIKPPARTPSLAIRWGNSIHKLDSSVIELNSQEATKKATDKRVMAKIFNGSKSVNFPPVLFTENFMRGELTAKIKELGWTGGVFVRDQYDHVRYTYPEDIRSTDKYVLKDILKETEYRVHIINGKTVGVYEKIPHTSNAKIYKDDNCDFKRLDMSNKSIRRRIAGVRPLAVAAVEELGLDFGGVDVLKSSDGKYYVNEVNSAPGLNGPNLERWTDKLIELINDRINNDTNSNDDARATTNVVVGSVDRPQRRENAQNTIEIRGSDGQVRQYNVSRQTLEEIERLVQTA